MNLILAFVAGAMTWSYIGRLAWRFVLKSKSPIGEESRGKYVEKMPHEDFVNLYESMRLEARRRGVTSD